ncbi:hypothetical protein HDU84_008434 [Entophlyctis sp. JEL0112]|nr:hypothetical protein HDU84_008434 [Entophlyctis sp. JEL0112]
MRGLRRLFASFAAAPPPPSPAVLLAGSASAPAAASSVLGSLSSLASNPDIQTLSPVGKSLVRARLDAHTTVVAARGAVAAVTPSVETVRETPGSGESKSNWIPDRLRAAFAPPTWGLVRLAASSDGVAFLRDVQGNGEVAVLRVGGSDAREMIVRRRGFVAAAGESIVVKPDLNTLAMSTLRVYNTGMLAVSAPSGSLQRIFLAVNEEIYVDRSLLVAWDASVNVTPTVERTSILGTGPSSIKPQAPLAPRYFRSISFKEIVDTPNWTGKAKLVGSPAWYVGYADDSESIASIMRKFEQLDDFKREVSGKFKSSASTAREEIDIDGPSTANIDGQLGEQELEELFRRTSRAPIQQFFNPNIVCQDFGDDWEDWDEEYADDSNYSGQDDDHELDTEIERPLSASGPKKRKFENFGLSDRPSDKIKDFKAVVVPRRFASGLGSSSHVSVKTQTGPKETNSFTNTVSIATLMGSSISIDFYDKHGMKLLKERLCDPIVVYMNPPLVQQSNISSSDVTIGEFANIKIPSVISSGYIFIWVEKEFTPSILKIAESWGFRYVENFAWIKWNKWHRIAAEPTKAIFKKSKATCLIFRKAIY